MCKPRRRAKLAHAMGLISGLAAVLCQTLLHSSTLFGAPADVVLEFTTPRNVAPHSQLLCFTDTRMVLNSTNFRLVSLVEGGDLFSTTGERTVLNASWGQNWAQAPFFLPATSLPVSLGAAEYGNIRDFLGGDTSYAQTLLHQRFVVALCARWGGMHTQTLIHTSQACTLSSGTTACGRTASGRAHPACLRSHPPTQLTRHLRQQGQRGTACCSQVDMRVRGWMDGWMDGWKTCLHAHNTTCFCSTCSCACYHCGRCVAAGDAI
jgi:hypothetical protein